MRALGLALVLVLLGAAPAFADPAVITSDDAVKPHAGTDYTRLATLRLGRYEGVAAVTGSKLVLISGLHETRYALLDPETGRRTRLPAPSRYPDIVEVTADRIWYTASVREPTTTTVYRYDRGGDRMRSFVLPVEKPRRAAHVIGLDGDTVWYGTARPREDNIYENVWSVEFGRPGTLTSHGRHKGNPRYADGILASTERGPTFDDPGRVVLRDVATGEVTRTVMPDGCSQRSDRIQSNGTQLVAVLACDNPEQKAIVLDRSGEISAVLQIAMEDGALGTSDRGVFFYDKFYDFASGRLLDISDIGNADIAPLSGPGDQPVQVWPQQDGRALVVRLK